VSKYDTDILLWSEHQAELLRRRAAGELVNDVELDWPNIAEEIEDVGNEQRNAVESLLTNIMQHRLQIAAWPQVQAVPHWQHEIDGWRVRVRRRLRRSPKLAAEMTNGLAELYSDAVASMYRVVEGQPRPAVPAECPWTLDELLAEPPESENVGGA
jgi:Domain of unknown function DUF29